MIRMENIGKAYTQKRGGKALTVLSGVNLQMREGEYMAFVGASGSGKSTLMHIMGCLDTPTEGRYFLCGEDVSRKSADELCDIRREHIGFVFQGFQLLQKLNALENVAFPLMLRGVSERERARRAMDALESVGLSNRANHRPAELSGGQQQRVALARALVYSPMLLMCDEPTGALDIESRNEVLELLDAQHKEGRTIIVITHDPQVAARAARRCIVQNGTVEEIMPTHAGNAPSN